MRHGSLFSGIGGFDLAAQWMGWENVFHCEWNEFGKRVLSYYWPNAISYHDVTKTDFTIHRGGIDILTGGFPCQPYSMAGKRKGKDDERHLWPEMLRAIREIQPRWVVGENVLGLVNWDGGLVFEEVQADLESQGYEVQPYVLPACAVGAPHRRDRVWFVAHANHEGGSTRPGQIQGADGQISERHDNAELGNASDADAADTNYKGLQRRTNIGIIGGGRQKRNEQPSGCVQPDWHKFPTQPPVCFRNDGFSPQLDGITFPKWRNESIKAAGNAIVPQVVYQIFKAIEAIEAYEKGN